MEKCVVTCSRKQKASQLAMITETLAFSASPVEVGLRSVQASARCNGAAKSTDGSFCLRSGYAEIKAIAFFWPH